MKTYTYYVHISEPMLLVNLMSNEANNNVKNKETLKIFKKLNPKQQQPGFVEKRHGKL